MQTSITDIVHIFFSLPVYFLCLLTTLSVVAFRQDCGSCLHRWRHLLMGLSVMAYLVSAPVFSNAVMQWLESRYTTSGGASISRDERTLIIVLAGGWLRVTTSGYEAKLSEEGWERTSSAVRLWQETGGRLLFSGAPIPGGADSVAAAMARAARLMGVPQQDILVEGRSLNTYENLKFSLPQITRNGGKTWLVTSALHMPRAMAVARSLGIDAAPYPCDLRNQAVVTWWQWLPSNNGPRAFEAALHEVFGIVLYRLRGWID